MTSDDTLTLQDIADHFITNLKVAEGVFPVYGDDTRTTETLSLPPFALAAFTRSSTSASSVAPLFARMASISVSDSISVRPSEQNNSRSPVLNSILLKSGDGGFPHPTDWVSV